MFADVVSIRLFDMKTLRKLFNHFQLCMKSFCKVLMIQSSFLIGFISDTWEIKSNKNKITYVMGPNNDPM